GANGKLARLLIAGKILGARAHGTRSPSRATWHGSRARTRQRGHKRPAYVCPTHKQLPGAQTSGSHGASAKDGLIPKTACDTKQKGPRSIRGPFFFEVL